MTRKAVITQGALALFGLLAAFLTWQRDPGPEEGHGVVLDLTQADLQKVRYEDGDTFVELTPGKDAQGEFVWVRLSGKKGFGGGALPAGHPVVQTDVPERLVRGNESARVLFKLFAPLYASRTLGVLDDERQKALGLDKTKKKLAVTYRGITRTFTLAPAPPGGTDPYLRADDDGRVYIIASRILSDLSAAQSNLVERRLHTFLSQEFDTLVIKNGAGREQKRYTLRRFTDGRPGGQLVPAGSDTPDETATTWHERMFALFPAEVLGQGEEPLGGPPTLLGRLEYSYRGKLLGWLDIARSREGEGPANAAASDASANHTPRSSVLVRSELSAGWLRLAVDAQGLVSEGETLFGMGP